jgi:hypothetical protein
MRAILIATVAALTFAATTFAAAPAGGPYKLDSNGRCHSTNGSIVPTKMCHDQPPQLVCKAGVSKLCGKACIPLASTCHKPA